MGKGVFRPKRFQVVKRLTFSDSSLIHFVVCVDGQLLLAEVVEHDVNLLTAGHISAILQYPANKVIAQLERVENNHDKWWIIAVVIGCGFLLLALGWLILFIYFNTCGASARAITSTQQFKSETKERVFTIPWTNIENNQQISKEVAGNNQQISGNVPESRYRLNGK
ncbi:hypothetical protein WR25_07748 [Diploscapter pachys]|uniref:Uncharacterized protein n=1 Tax=Diploscapter pachys TaxID=2018661 RepID=A0A2A2KIE6_9BILA|nr:hypothetical protein WR25_07748 [Diploscapter pachys]